MLSQLIVALCLVLGFVSAQLPLFPDNINVFPDNDIVNVEGFNGASASGNYAGKKIQVQVVRSVNGVSSVIGEAFPTVSGKFIAFDINHPFGFCWGAGSKYQVTPDIQGGDQVLLLADGKQIASSTVQKTKITKKTIQNNVVTITGTGVSSLANPTFLECRIVQPALRNTLIGRRDVRAIPLINFPKAVAYTSSLTTNGDAFTCQFNFLDAANLPNSATAASAYEGLFLLTSWQAEDAAGNPQGLTISEFGAFGGPMDATCPPSANLIEPMATEGIAYDGAKIYWNEAKNVPGAAHVFNNYNVEAQRTTTTAGVTSVIGVKTPSTQRSAAVAAPLQANDVLHVRAWSDYPVEGVDVLSPSKRTLVAAIINVAAPVAPTFSAAADAIVSTVSLASSDNIQLAYTLSTGIAGVAPVLGTNAILYSPNEPIKIVGTQTVVAVAFDHAGHVSAAATATFTNPTPAAVTGVTSVTTGLSKITVAWDPFTSGPVTGFNVYHFLNGVKTFVATAPAAPFWTDVTGLVGGNAYPFAVAAVNTHNGVVYEGPLSEVSNAAVFLQNTVDALTYTIKYAPGNELRVSGTGNVEGATVSVVDTQTGVTLGSGAISAGTFQIRIRPVAANVFSVNIVSSFGFVAVNIPTL